MTEPRPLSIGAVVGRLILLVGGLTLGLTCVLVGVILFTGERTIYQRASSPDGWREARVQFDDAGAVDGFSRLVFVKT